MPLLPPEYEDFWRAAEQARPGLARARFYEAFAFGDSQAMADELAALVLIGRKRATASLVWTYEHERRPPPRAGDLSIVTSWAKQPLCLIETTAVEVLPFEDVGEDFACTEGEGEATLASWRRDHSAFFAAECRRIGRTPNPRMPVVCERFSVVYQPAPPPAVVPPAG